MITNVHAVIVRDGHRWILAPGSRGDRRILLIIREIVEHGSTYGLTLDEIVEDVRGDPRLAGAREEVMPAIVVKGSLGRGRAA